MESDSDTFYADLGALVRSARNAKRITQADLAVRIGLARTSVTNIERGRQPVLVYQLSTIARELGVSIAQLTPDLSRSALRPEAADVEARVPSAQRDWVSRVIRGGT